MAGDGLIFGNRNDNGFFEALGHRVLAEGGVEDISEDSCQFSSAVVENGRADVVWVGGFVSLKSPENAPHLRLVNNKGGGGREEMVE